MANPFILVLDGIEDPHNFGAILRTAECAGVTEVIIRKVRQVQVTETVVKVSTGAANIVKIRKVPNIAEAIRALQNDGVTVVGLESSGSIEYTKADLNLPLALVIGSEGKGISHLVKERCDYLVNIPLKGKITSLNASVAAGIAMFEVVRQRMV
ncbi:23S rRNA (guanosine(2251)-2'-O)-methyltransferase RlmB [candidate division WOR-1 bacterium RIFOXYA12_FULL_43_27]|uniref:23S rRNA (Guanosine(2251)-2'-O)-methyltransferase RlmB n=1 Tax=candidate division WOR-1 bacterium RIFOXYC2_FULL_46_14 TaxID=1802587 RepID=A0A1F4U3W0_UNCSA|nr:MAG: 23S rRNA (guanosine(2251)-2'-O)-methyltransferase RlmB [candidate division WOR-1 bacterium RIFOXYA12_FULL_43_27]OGC18896.1 MAG: 23S rRNA (guanosine(2251)-2'-O)-methyltransferase RlmB [candidate division WOR-1 bacterium RIFOXYB2_FULL_46_45]OGC29037.1 MAG: 23S rRNA (guanosine(2251)-2'-O)-methyltransferase RlmB [candidate division WOR-1 bacterium RIFOXYA2_FULL_46_56]OGC39658.1 MAG: 23S rRNA (guanosine(2251)-2'-O)-methyltransferase RlmB [candidate division WOR-1 bacterium RIFOXYC2_FULL_46_14